MSGNEGRGGDARPDANDDVSLADELSRALDDADEAAQEAAGADEGDDEALALDQGDDAAKDAPEGGDEAAGDGPDKDADQPGEIVEAMQHWPKEWRDRFATIPDEAKSYVRDVHKFLGDEHAKRVREISERETSIKRLEGISEALEPVREEMALAGIDEVTGVRALIAAHQFLQRDPAGAIRHLAKQYGADLSALAAGQSKPAEPEYLDEAAGKKIGELTSRLDQIEQAKQAEAQGRQRDQQSKVIAEVEAFRTATAEDGAPAHPHFDKVRVAMGVMIQADPKMTMDQAYEAAVYADPDLREVMISRRTAAEAQKREAERKAAVERQKRASAGQRPSRPAKPANKPAMHPRDDLEAAWDQVAN